MRKATAYAFKTDLSLEQLFERLNTRGPWEWSRRDSEHYGDYISTRALADYAMVKIFVEPERYVVDLAFRSERADAEIEWTTLCDTVVRDVLPALGAREVEPTETYN